jgi:hypothetical protein
MLTLKNYTTEMPINRIFDNIRAVLVEHGAKQIVQEYDTNGEIAGLTFVVPLADRLLPVKLPARVERVQYLMERLSQAGQVKDDHIRRLFLHGDTVKRRQQAYRIAWKNIHDWIAAQMALLDIEQVKLEEIFLPYITNSHGTTLFEVYEQAKFQLPELMGDASL